MNSSELLSSASLGPLCALGSAATWAIGSTAYSHLSKTYSAFAINFARATIALPLFILTSIFISGGVRQGWISYQNVNLHQWAWLTLSMVASYGVGDVLFLWSAQSLGVPGALAIASCYPIWTVFAGYFFSGETISWMQGIGLLFVVAGIVVVILNQPKLQKDQKSNVGFLGVFLALATSVAWAANSFAVARGSVGVAPAIGSTIRMILGLILTASLGKILTPSMSIFLPKREIFRFFWLFSIEAFGGSYLFMYGLSHSPLAVGATFASLSPVLAVPVALVLGLEKFSIFRSLGVGIVVLGIWFLVRTF